KTFNFAGTTLKLVEMPGVAYDTASVARIVELKFGEENRMAGNTGCNIVNGQFYANADTLRFPQPMAMTRMMCDETSNAVEMAMTNMLANTNRYTVENDMMSLYNGDELLAKFRIISVPGCCKHHDGKQCEHKCAKEGEKCCKHHDGEPGEHKCAKEGEKCCKHQGGELSEHKCVKEGEKCCKHQGGELSEHKCVKEGEKCCKQQGDSSQKVCTGKCMKENAASQKPCVKKCEKACTAQPATK
ncbi:MAG: META domain-containing protein, partial [Candidatus Aphodosoma sp.]